MRNLILATLAGLALAGCTYATPGSATGGMTAVSLDGSLCGAPVKLTVLEGQDRKGFTASCTTPDGSSVNVTSQEANGSTAQQQVLAAQTQLIGQLVGTVTSLAKPAVAAATGGVAP